MYFELFMFFITFCIILLSLDVFGLELFKASNGSSSLKFKASVYSACAFLGEAVDVEGCGSILFVKFNKLLYIHT